ncbi:1-acyl-sn-glycerol-3-phosphate acyltransferase [Taibaiella sp. KBW10]|uniref:lysophospholipid acyltransferase family protein n=1 Tax=Taibaiella sp. KBW10 TaxID=2153357 RepID=UPI000F59E863|nr:lysophospholipid acyltransferase family protein [Taibaiella sp. KBW10]RQO31039.1 1-acyl-sn-glycerol-3-phosphate acyltransferase [Taibaiella sp. KBW10]
MNIFKRVFGHLYFVYGMILFFITMLIALIPASIALLFPEPRRAKIIHPTYKIWMSIFLPLVGCPVRRTGKAHFKKGENYVVVINHNSLVDIPVSMPWVPGPNKTLAKIEMTKVPLFGIIYRAGSILVDRKNDRSRNESLTKMQETLKMGLHLTLYPEGTRNKTDKPLQPFYDGAFMNAIMAQKPIIPGLIFSTKEILPHHIKLWAWPKTIRIHFLEPIPTAGLELKDKKVLKEQVYAIMEQHYRTNR